MEGPLVDVEELAQERVALDPVIQAVDPLHAFVVRVQNLPALQPQPEPNHLPDPHERAAIVERREAGAMGRQESALDRLDAEAGFMTDVVDEESIEPDHVRVAIGREIQPDKLRVFAVSSELATGWAGPEFWEDDTVVAH